MSFGEVLKNLREERGVKQKEVANSCSLTPTCICQLENGSRNPTGSTIRELAKYFNCSADFLLELTDDFGSIIAAPTAPALSSEEEQLIADYRKLTPPLKRMVQETMRTFTGSELNSQSTKKNA